MDSWHFCFWYWEGSILWILLLSNSLSTVQKWRFGRYYYLFKRVWCLCRFCQFFIDVVINIVGFLPSIFISTANGLIFGLFWGTIISWLAETLGVMISFWIMRVLFRSLAKRVIEQSKTLTALDSYDSWQAVAVARAIPYMPNGLVTAICALSSMSFRSHMAGSLLGKLPSVALEVVVGHDVVHLGEHSLRLTIIIIVVSAVYGAVWWYMKRGSRGRGIYKFVLKQSK